MSEFAFYMAVLAARVQRQPVRHRVRHRAGDGDRSRCPGVVVGAAGADAAPAT